LTGLEPINVTTMPESSAGAFVLLSTPRLRPSSSVTFTCMEELAVNIGLGPVAVIKLFSYGRAAVYLAPPPKSKAESGSVTAVVLREPMLKSNFG